MFAVEAGDLAGGFAFNGALFQIAAFVAGFFSSADAEFGFELAIFPIELEDDEGAALYLGFAVELVDLLPVQQ